MKAIVDVMVNLRLEIDDQDEMETLHKAIVLANPPRKCDECGVEEGFYLTSNKDKEGNIYVNMKCVCDARAKLGRYKTGGYFWHKFEKYIPKSSPSK